MCGHVNRALHTNQKAFLLHWLRQQNCNKINFSNFKFSMKETQHLLHLSIKKFILSSTKSQLEGKPEISCYWVD